MKRWCVVILLCCLSLGGCGSFFVGFVSNPGGTSSVSGTVTIVNIQFFHDLSRTTLMTAVTFVNVGTSVTIKFCGDQRNLFTVNQVVQVNFTSGFSCSTVLAVVIIGNHAGQM